MHYKKKEKISIKENSYLNLTLTAAMRNNAAKEKNKFSLHVVGHRFTLMKLAFWNDSLQFSLHPVMTNMTVKCRAVAKSCM